MSALCVRSVTFSGMVSHFYNAMRFGMAYRDPGADHYERKYRERVAKSPYRRAAEFGYTLQATDCVS